MGQANCFGLLSSEKAGTATQTHGHERLPKRKSQETTTHPKRRMNNDTARRSPPALPPCLQADPCGAQTHRLGAGRRKEKPLISFQPLLWWRFVQFGCLAAPFEWAKLE